MRRHFAAMLAELFYFQTLLGHLLVLVGLVILVLAHGAGQGNEVFL
jgi:hypothetical protein